MELSVDARTTAVNASAAPRAQYGSVRSQEAPRSRHSRLYLILNSNSTRHGSVYFNRCLALLILANVLVDVMITVKAFDEVYGGACRTFETASSLLFIGEYVARFRVSSERLKFRGPRGRLRFLCSREAVIDVLSFAPWVFEKLISQRDVPATAFVRVFRMLRILKTERFTGAVDAIVRVVSTNGTMLGMAAVMVGMLILFTSTLLYYANNGHPVHGDDFSSIPATMYLSILMLTGQGEPDGELTVTTKVLCVFTALFSVALVAIPASMLTFGFEIEATRLVKKRRERRLRRRIRAQTGDAGIASCSDSEVDDERLLARERRAGARRRARCSGLVGAGPVAEPLSLRRWDDDGAEPTGFELSSSEDEYETIVLGETEDEALEKVKRELADEAYKHLVQIAHDDIDERHSAPVYAQLLSRIRSHEFRAREKRRASLRAPPAGLS